jgi:hypothetical protein
MSHLWAQGLRPPPWRRGGMEIQTVLPLLLLGLAHLDCLLCGERLSSAAARVSSILPGWDCAWCGYLVRRLVAAGAAFIARI